MNRDELYKKGQVRWTHRAHEEFKVVLLEELTKRPFQSHYQLRELLYPEAKYGLDMLLLARIECALEELTAEEKVRCSEKDGTYYLPGTTDPQVTVTLLKSEVETVLDALRRYAWAHAVCQKLEGAL